MNRTLDRMKFGIPMMRAFGGPNGCGRFVISLGNVVDDVVRFCCCGFVERKMITFTHIPIYYDSKKECIVRRLCL